MSQTKRLKEGKDASKSIRFIQQFLRFTVVLCILAALGILLASCDPNAKDKTNAPTGQTSNKDAKEENQAPPIDYAKAIKSTVNGNTQYVTSTLTSTSYDPILVKEGIPVQWTLKVPEGALNACNNEIYIDVYGIDVKLQVGDNVIEFVPAEAGTFRFSCWMYMIFSFIAVEDKDGNIPPVKDDKILWKSTSPCCEDAPE